jgi:hypothetical protein
MRRWTVGFNDYWYTASIWLEETPWYLVLAEWAVSWVCFALHYIPVPKKWREDYGSLGGLFHVYVCASVTQFVWDRTKTTTVRLPFFMLRKMFPKEAELIDEDFWEDDEQWEENKKSAKALDKVFEDAYSILEEHECRINKRRRL